MLCINKPGHEKCILISCADPEGGGAGGPENHKNIGFLNNTGPDPP